MDTEDVVMTEDVISANHDVRTGTIISAIICVLTVASFTLIRKIALIDGLVIGLCCLAIMSPLISSFIARRNNCKLSSKQRAICVVIALICVGAAIAVGIMRFS